MILQEFDTPHTLIQNADSCLSKLAESAGQNSYNELREIASKTHHKGRL